MKEGRGIRVPRSMGPKVHGSKGPRYLKFTFKYELDSKEGPSCLDFLFNNYEMYDYKQFKNFDCFFFEFKVVLLLKK